MQPLLLYWQHAYRNMQVQTDRGHCGAAAVMLFRSGNLSLVKKVLIFCLMDHL